MYLRYDLEPYSDVQVRKAMQMAIDIQALNDAFFQGEAGNFPSMVTPDWPDYHTPLSEYPQDVQEAFSYNPEKAKALLAEAGYPDGFKQEMPMSSAAGTLDRDLADMFIQYWEDIGIETEIRTVEAAAMYSFATSGEQQMNWFWSSFTWMPTNALNTVSHGQATTPWNYGNVDDPYFNDITDKIREEPDAAKRDKMLKELFFYGTTQFYSVNGPIHYYYTTWWPWMKGYTGETRSCVWGVSQIYARVWIDQDLKAEILGR